MPVTSLVGMREVQEMLNESEKNERLLDVSLLKESKMQRWSR